MVSETFKITNEEGLTMRPAQVFVCAMDKYSSAITIKFKNKAINGKSIISLMAGGIKCGSEITVECSGTDENEMLSEVKELIESGFNEQ